MKKAFLEIVVVVVVEPEEEGWEGGEGGGKVPNIPHELTIRTSRKAFSL